MKVLSNVFNGAVLQKKVIPLFLAAVLFTVYSCGSSPAPQSASKPAASGSASVSVSASTSKPSSSYNGADAEAAAYAALAAMSGGKSAPAATASKPVASAPAASAPAQAAPAPAALPQTNVAKSKPAWIGDPNSVYPKDMYVAADAEGKTRLEAEQAALARLVSIFGQSVQSELQTVSTYQEQVKNGASKVESSDSLYNAITTKAGMDTLLGAEIPEVYEDARTKKFYAIAVMNRDVAGILYSNIITANVKYLDSLTNVSDTEKYSLDGYARYLIAGKIAAMNRLYFQVLTQVGRNNTGLSENDLKSESYYKLQAAEITKKIPIGVVVTGADKNGRVAGAYAAVFNKQGFQTGGTNSRYQLKVNVVNDDVTSSYPNPGTFKYARIEVDSKLVDTKNGNAVLLPWNFNDRQGRGTVPDAQEFTIRSAEKIIPDQYPKVLSDYLASLLPS